MLEAKNHDYGKHHKLKPNFENEEEYQKALSHEIKEYERQLEERVELIRNNPGKTPGFLDADASTQKIVQDFYNKEHKTALNPVLKAVLDPCTNNAFTYASIGTIGKNNASQTLKYRNPALLHSNGKHWEDWQLQEMGDNKIYAVNHITVVVATTTEALIGERYIMDYVEKHYPHLMSLNQGKYGWDYDPKGEKLHFFSLTIFHNVKHSILQGTAALSSWMSDTLKERLRVSNGYDGRANLQIRITWTGMVSI